DYIKESIGPKALVTDLVKTARVLARFGPLLPQMAEDALIQAKTPQEAAKPTKSYMPLVWMALGGALVFGGLVLGYMI
ncbi:MAG: 2-polyprenylphenol 6-hydroxylase, partial [Paracoccaceae bacterium]|nr:2-polyprenylphenol 6-hydroxylase [Paracoccaceae bacterium]